LTATSGAKADAKKEKRSIEVEEEAAQGGGLGSAMTGFWVPTACCGHAREAPNSELRRRTAV
jgi:hypothetical protein